VIYRLFRNRVLQVGIRAMSVLSGPELGEFPVCMRHVWKYCRYLFWCSVLLGGLERSGGVAECFGFVGLAWEVSLAAEVQLVVVGVKVHVDFELDDVCLVEGKW